jgi:endogenous inhibitor of DNA gyrase (YacG/DUF329 family)
MKVNCPTCQKTIQWSEAHPHRPFCSKRCQLIDLGEWSDEQFSIAGSSPDVGQQQQIDIEDIESLLAEQNESFFKQ